MSLCTRYVIFDRLTPSFQIGVQALPILTKGKSLCWACLPCLFLLKMLSQARLLNTTQATTLQNWAWRTQFAKIRKDLSSNLCTSELMQEVLLTQLIWKQLAWEAQSPTANSLRLPASAFAYSHGHHGPSWRTKPQTNLKLVHSFSFSSPRTHKNLGLACLPSMPAELCSFQFAEPAPEHQSLNSSTQGED